MKMRGKFLNRTALGIGFLGSVFTLAIPMALAQAGGSEFTDTFGEADAQQQIDPNRVRAGAEEKPVSLQQMIARPVVQPIDGEVVAPVIEPAPVMHWDITDAAVLLAVVEAISVEGLFPQDYQPELLREAMVKSESDGLNEAASRTFTWLVEDLRDGRTPMPKRSQWFVVDSDQDDMPTEQLMARAINDHDVAGVLESLAPRHPDYAALKAELAILSGEAPQPEDAIIPAQDALIESEDPSGEAVLSQEEAAPDENPIPEESVSPEEIEKRRGLIRANMDRWRWLRRDLGEVHLITNVPEFQLRLVVKDRIIRTYRTVVGKPGRSATPQLAETVSAVVFNPTWTVPQSIVKGEGLGAQLLANPDKARRENYKVKQSENGYISVVQQPGPGNALGLMKIDMPNPHAIYLHDTPSKRYFNYKVRAYSHGCIRTERAVELGMTMAILGARMSGAEAAEISRSGEYTKVRMTRTFPVYITYFTMGVSIDGTLQEFADLYGRDKAVLESFATPRRLKTAQRKSDEEIVELDNPL